MSNARLALTHGRPRLTIRGVRQPPQAPHLRRVAAATRSPHAAPAAGSRTTRSTADRPRAQHPPRRAGGRPRSAPRLCGAREGTASRQTALSDAAAGGPAWLDQSTSAAPQLCNNFTQAVCSAARVTTCRPCRETGEAPSAPSDSLKARRRPRQWPLSRVAASEMLAPLRAPLTRTTAPFNSRNSVARPCQLEALCMARGTQEPAPA